MKQVKSNKMVLQVLRAIRECEQISYKPLVQREKYVKRVQRMIENKNK